MSRMRRIIATTAMVLALTGVGVQPAIADNIGPEVEISVADNSKIPAGQLVTINFYDVDVVDFVFAEAFKGKKLDDVYAIVQEPTYTLVYPTDNLAGKYTLTYVATDSQGNGISGAVSFVVQR